MSGTESVKVIVRMRPLNSSEKSKNCQVIIQIDRESNSCTIQNPKTSIPKFFTFDSVFDTGISQQELYDETAFQLVESVIEGYNGTIFAYGQTGCGKTFTMSGSAENKGIIPNSFSHIFEAISLADSSKMFLVRCSYLEIYNEEVRDLLEFDPSLKLELKESKDKGIFVKGLSQKLVKSVQEIEKMMSYGTSHRITKETNMNEKSSRSHAIFTVYVETSENSEKRSVIKAGKLNMVDLAGSERQKKTGAQGERMKEAIEINLSLSALGNVISALVDGNSSHVPYRDSKLTRLLQDSLGGNTKTVMIAVVSPADYNYEESLSTLRYASRAKFIQNKPKVNEDPKDTLIREYYEEIQKLKRMLEDKTSAPIYIEKIVEKEVIVEKEKIIKMPSQRKRAKRLEDEEDPKPLNPDQEEEKSTKTSRLKSRTKKSDILMKFLPQHHLYTESATSPPSRKDIPSITTPLSEVPISKQDHSPIQLRSGLKPKNFNLAITQELEIREKQLKEERSQRLQLEVALSDLKQKLISGGEQSFSGAKDKLRAQREKRRNIKKKVNKTDEDEDKKKFSSPQEEIEDLKRTVKKLKGNYRAALAEIEDLHKEHEREKEELLEAIRNKDKENGFFVKVFEFLIPVQEIQKIKNLSRFDENNHQWHIKPFTVQNRQTVFPKLPKAQILESIQSEVKNKNLIFQKSSNVPVMDEGEEVNENIKLFSKMKRYEQDRDEFRPVSGLGNRELTGLRRWV